MLIMLYVNLKL